MASELIIGRKPLLEALEEGREIEKVFIHHGTHGPGVDAIYKAAKRRGIQVRQASKERFREMAEGRETQGVIGILAVVPSHDLEDLLALVPPSAQAFLLVLDEIEDPQNLGALLRSAASFGVHGVVIPKHHSASVNATVVKTSAGAALKVPVARVGNIVQALTRLKESGLLVVGADAKGEKSVDELHRTGPVALVIGNEGKGLRRLVRETCDFLVRIPMPGGFESLNASVAGGILMYELCRNRTLEIADS